MTWRFAVAALVAVGLGIAVFATLKIDRDVRGVLGDAGDAAAVLDTPEGRLMTLAVIHPDPERRRRIARAVVDRLTSDPMVAHVTTGPDTPSRELLEWLWQARFLLAPPASGDLTADAMAATMADARAALLDPARAPLASKYLLDPTGSFRRLTEALRNAGSSALPRNAGMAGTGDGTAALLLIELAAVPFDTARQAAFDAALRTQVQEAGAEALIVGPRSISARISERIAGRSMLAATIGSVLVLLWVALILRPSVALPVPFLPAVIGGLAATLAVQAIFGSIHAIAVGFGGVLLGLAIDYPFHMIGHAARSLQRRHAARKVMIGAATSAAAFGALVLSGIPAIAQAGCFVAIGLLCAAGAAIWMVPAGSGLRMLTERVALRPIETRLKLPVLLAVVAICTAALSAVPQRPVDRLIAIPGDVQNDIARQAAMTDPPSGQHVIAVTAGTLRGLVDTLRDVSDRLDRLAAGGAISRHVSLVDALPADEASGNLPAPDRIAPVMAEALDRAGLAPSFLEDIVSAYRAAPRPDGAGKALGPLPALAPPLSGILEQSGAGFRAQIRLWGVTDADALAQVSGPGVEVIDRRGAFTAQLRHLLDRVWLCFAVGAVAACAVLLITVRPRLRALEIALATGAACIATALLAVLVTGGLGVFQILALALVAGIGIDYGLFLVLNSPDGEDTLGRHSVLVCASTTLIAFVTMSLSGVSLLQDIGLAVSAGVAATLAANLFRQRAHGAAGNRG